MTVLDEPNTKAEEVTSFSSKVKKEEVTSTSTAFTQPPSSERNMKDRLSEASTTEKDAPSNCTSEGTPHKEQENLTTAQVPSYTKIMTLAKPEWCMLTVAFFIMVAAEATSLYNPLLLANAYDYLVDPTLTSEQRMAEINQVMAVVLVIHFCGVLAGFLRSAIMSAAGERVVARLRAQVFSAILNQDMSFFDETKTGELVSRLSSDTTLLQQATSQALPEVILGLTKLVVSVALMFWISAALAGITLGMVGAIFLVCIPFGKWIGKLSKSYQDVLGQAQTCSTEALGAMRTVQSFTAEDRERARYRKKIGNPDDFYFWWPYPIVDRTTYSVGFNKAIVSSAFYTFIFGVGFGSLYVTLWYGFNLVDEGVISLGDLTAFQSYIFQIGGALAQTSRFLTQLMEAKGASGRIFYLLERIPAIPTPLLEKDGDEEIAKPFKKPASMQGAIDFSNVDFNYPSRPDVPVLQGFSLSIEADTTVAVVGSSGAGKSTIVALLQRFYDVTSGSITIDGADIRELDLKWLRSRIGYVQQEPQVFGLTVRENIVYGVDRPVSEQELEAVCEKANAHDFIVQWPNGYDTMVGERGVKLSGGQKQRLAIARALLTDPRILLLDEATSSLDAESEHLVQEAIEKAVVGRTVVIVAHRLSTIQRANQIVVLDRQRIVDVAPHDVLLNRCSKYQDLIKRQSVVSRLPGELVIANDNSTTK